MNMWELDRRAHEVFLLDEGDIVYSVEGDPETTLVKIVNMNGCKETDYYPDMSERPEALNYLLGYRDDFND